MGLPRLPESAVARQGDGILGPSHACGCRSAIVSGCLPSLNPPRSFSCPPGGEEPPGHLRQSNQKRKLSVLFPREGTSYERVLKNWTSRELHRLPTISDRKSTRLNSS